MAFLWPATLTPEDPGGQRLHRGFRDPGTVGKSWTVEGRLWQRLGGWGLGDVAVSEFMVISWLSFIGMVYIYIGLWLTNYSQSYPRNLKAPRKWCQSMAGFDLVEDFHQPTLILWTRYGSSLNPLHVSQCPWYKIQYWYNARLLVFKRLKTQTETTCQVRLQQKVSFGFGGWLRFANRMFLGTQQNPTDDHVAWNDPKIILACSYVSHPPIMNLRRNLPHFSIHSTIPRMRRPGQHLQDGRFQSGGVDPGSGGASLIPFVKLMMIPYAYRWLVGAWWQNWHMANESASAMISESESTQVCT